MPGTLYAATPIKNLENFLNSSPFVSQMFLKATAESLPSVLSFKSSTFLYWTLTSLPDLPVSSISLHSSLHSVVRMRAFPTGK